MDLVNDRPRVLGNRYEVGDLLGRGGMAEVHLGRDTRLGRTVAIKLLRTDLARDPTFQARFRREAQSAASLNHPAIVSVYDTGEETITEIGGGVVSLPYIVMEYIEGRTLRDILSEGRPLDVDLALDVTTGVLNALEYSHRIGIVHRDIKPANVMLTPTGDVKVMDFGIARAMSDASSTMTQTQAVIGTAQYLSPEQARGEQVDTRSDLYSTGCLLFELLTGRPPFQADSPVAVAYQHVREQPPVPSDLARGIPESVDRIVLHSLAKDREARYQSAAEFRTDVEAARGGRQVLAQPVPVASAADTATQYLGMTPAGPGTRAMAPVSGGTGLLGTEPPQGPTSPYDDRYGDYYGEERNKKTPWIVAGVVVVVLALVAFLVSQLVNGGGGNGGAATKVTVPSVTGVVEALARTTLEDKGLKVTTEPRVTDDADEVGKVIEQDPAAETQVDTGSTVNLVIGTEPGTVTVPDVIGKQQADAISELNDAGLAIAEVKQETPKDSDIEPGEVIRTDPEEGEEVEKSTKVTLFVASNSLTMDDYLGDSVDEARRKLIDLGFEVKVQLREEENIAAGTVVGQSPRPGARVERGAEVTLIVAEEPEEDPEPTETPSPSDTPSVTPSPSETDEPGD
jgi:beta-lactam-binding protein with PASTA domain/predicted Ser/Thr protein kinase